MLVKKRDNENDGEKGRIIGLTRKKLRPNGYKIRPIIVKWDFFIKKRCLGENKNYREE